MALSTLAVQIEFLMDGLDELPFTQRSEELLKRMTLVFSIDEGAAAFHGLTYTYLVAKQAPERNPQSHRGPLSQVRRAGHARTQGLDAASSHLPIRRPAVGKAS
jgi:hypothetical protein